jgi:hypothetical protein
MERLRGRANTTLGTGLAKLTAWNRMSPYLPEIGPRVGENGCVIDDGMRLVLSSV